MPQIVKILLASPKGQIIIPFILENRIEEFRRGVNKGEVDIWPIGNFNEQEIKMYSTYVVNYAKDINPSIDVKQWVEALELITIKNKEDRKQQNEEDSLRRLNRKAFIVSAPYGTEITKEEYEADVPVEQKPLWKVSRTESIQTGAEEFDEQIFYKKYPPAPTPSTPPRLGPNDFSRVDLSTLTPKERVAFKAKYGKKMGFLNQAKTFGNTLRSKFRFWGGKKSRKTRRRTKKRQTRKRK
jgi:hypothetical protein